MSRQFSIALVTFGVLLMSILLLVLLDKHPSKRTIGGNMNCERTYNLPVGERLFTATDRELITTVSPDTQARTYRLRGFNGNYCSIIQER